MAGSSRAGVLMELLCCGKKLLRIAALGNTCCNPARKALFSSVVGAGVDGATNFLEHLSSPECLKSMLAILDGSC